MTWGEEYPQITQMNNLTELKNSTKSRPTR